MRIGNSELEKSGLEIINMKKIITWLLLIFLFFFVIDWGIMGLKILNGNYDIIIEAYIGLICFIGLFSCIAIRLLCNKCPHCGKMRVSNGMYCPYCRKEL
jgi:hypothetical protein